MNDNCLYYFEYTTDKEPRGIIPLENICVSIGFVFFAINRRCGEKDDHRACFVLVEVSDRMFVKGPLYVF